MRSAPNSAFIIAGVFWTALFCAAVTATAYVTEFFVVIQFLALSVAATIGVAGKDRTRIPYAALASGFLAWILLCATEEWFGALHRVSSATPSRVSAVAVEIIDLFEFEDNSAKYAHFQRVETAVRVAFGNLFGLATYVLALGWLYTQRSNDQHHTQDAPDPPPEST